MRVIDEITEQEIFEEPDLVAGELIHFPQWVPAEAYERAKAEGREAVLDSDYEEVLVYHVLTDKEIAERDKKERERIEAEGRNNMLFALAEAFTETFEPSDKQGQLFKVVKLGEVEIMREYVTDPDYDPEAEDGTYLKPFKYTAGMEVIETKWYWLDDKDLPHECIKSGIPTGFDDTEYFDIVG